MENPKVVESFSLVVGGQCCASAHRSEQQGEKQNAAEQVQDGETPHICSLQHRIQALGEEATAFPVRIYHKSDERGEDWVVSYKQNGAMETKWFRCKKQDGSATCSGARQEAWDWVLDALGATKKSSEAAEKENHGTFRVFDKPDENCSLSAAGILLWDPDTMTFERNDFCSNCTLIRTEFSGGTFVRVYKCMGHGGAEDNGEVREAETMYDVVPAPEALGEHAYTENWEKDFAAENVDREKNARMLLEKFYRRPIP